MLIMIIKMSCYCFEKTNVDKTHIFVIISLNKSSVITGQS